MLAIKNATLVMRDHYITNAVILLGLTAGLAILWVNELRRANGRHHCCRSNGQ